MPTYLYENKETLPFQTHLIREIDDDEHSWRDVLLARDGTPDLEIVDENGKRRASVLVGAEYAPSAPSKEEQFITAVHSLILDVDAWESVTPYSLDEIKRRLDGLCFIVFSTWKSTAEEPRWRLVVPLASPIPPSKVRSLVRTVMLHPDILGPVVSEKTINPNRLGYIGIVASEKGRQDFQWHFNVGEKLDWRIYQHILVDDFGGSAGKDVGFPARPKYEISREIALRACVREYEPRFSGLVAGGGRSAALFTTSCQLWWDWAAEDEDFVREALSQLNDKCLEPESAEEVELYVRRGKDRAGGTTGQNEDYGHKRVPRNVISKDSMREFSKRLSRRRGDEPKRTALLVKRAAIGEALSDDSATWRTDVFKVAAALAEGFSTDAPDRIASFLTPSLAVMRARGDVSIPSEEEIVQYIHRKAHLAVRRTEERESARKDALKSNISFAFFGNRDTPYTKHELSDFERSCGLCRHSWIVLCKNSYYVFVGGKYIGPKNEKELQMEIHKWLSPAHEVLELTVLSADKTGAMVPREKTLEELCKDYGCSAEVEMDNRIETPFFKEEGTRRVLTVCGLTRNDFEPKFRKDVDTWLRAFFSESDYELVCDWLALFDDLTRPLAGLYIKGPPSTGKGVFVNGLAKMWQGGTVKYNHLLGDFNGLLERTPVVWADENIPRAVQTSSDIREFITQDEWDLNRKNRDHCKLYGYLRFIFTANNFNMFANFKDSPDSDDLEAFAQRLVSVTVRNEAANYFKSDGDSALYKAIMQDGALVEHMLWIKEQRRSAVRARGIRCGVMMGDRSGNEVIARFQVTSPVCDYICNFLVDTLLSAKKAKAALGKHTLVKSSNVLVHTEAMVSSMAAVDARMPFRKPEVSRNVALLSGHNRTKTQRGGAHYHVIDKSLLKAWVDNTSYTDWEYIEEAIRLLDEDRPVSVVSNNPHVASGVSSAELAIIEARDADEAEGAAQ